MKHLAKWKGFINKCDENGVVSVSVACGIDVGGLSLINGHHCPI